MEVIMKKVLFSIVLLTVANAFAVKPETKKSRTTTQKRPTLTDPKSKGMTWKQQLDTIDGEDKKLQTQKTTAQKELETTLVNLQHNKSNPLDLEKTSKVLEELAIQEQIEGFTQEAQLAATNLQKSTQQGINL